MKSQVVLLLQIAVPPVGGVQGAHEVPQVLVLLFREQTPLQSCVVDEQGYVQTFALQVGTELALPAGQSELAQHWTHAPPVVQDFVPAGHE